MAFNVQNLTIKNFLSVGNITQAVNFDRHDLTLVLGENLDLGGAGEGLRNGAGKTTIANALSYVLFGAALTKIKKANLINKTNDKHMIVTVDFEKDGKIYHIERGRKPSFLHFWEGDTPDMVDNEAQGDSRNTQDEIEKAFGMSHDMFKHIIALNTFTEPFLAMREADQRDIIEQLLGVTLLSEKAEKLKELIKDSKAFIKEEELRIAADTDANKRITEQIKSLERRQKLWVKHRESDIVFIEQSIDKLSNLDIEAEILIHKKLDEWEKTNTKRAEYEKLLTNIQKTKKREHDTINRVETELIDLEQSKCHICGQAFHGEKHDETLATKKAALKQAKNLYDECSTKVTSTERELSLLGLDDKPKTFYNEVEDAYNHRHSIENLEEKFKAKHTEIDPYAEQIVEMKEQALMKIDYTNLNNHSTLLEHQAFLYKLLTNKDSYIRKRIIEQNLAHLNARLAHYLTDVGLPHQVQFQNDLTVEITELGRDLDFGNLSRGERNRLILSLSWAFRDVWEALFQPINLLFVDELIDSGMDAKGVELALAVLKHMGRDQKKSVWLVSHRDDLASRVNNILLVTKENGFTNFSTDFFLE